MHPELLLLIGISLSLGFTPGPNNAVAAYSGFNFGIRKTLLDFLFSHLKKFLKMKFYKLDKLKKLFQEL